MNEPASFGTNEERPFNWPEDDKPYWSLNCTLEGSTIEHPPYRTSKSQKLAYKYIVTIFLYKRPLSYSIINILEDFETASPRLNSFKYLLDRKQLRHTF